MTRTPRARLPEQFRPAWDTMQALTERADVRRGVREQPGDARVRDGSTSTRACSSAARSTQRYKQLARLKLSLLHGCRTCNRQNVPGALAAGVSQAQIDAMDRLRVRTVHRRREGRARLCRRSRAHEHERPPDARALRAAARAFLRGRHPRARRRDGRDLGDGQALLRARPGREGELLPVRRQATPPDDRRVDIRCQNGEGRLAPASARRQRSTPLPAELHPDCSP